MNFRRLLLVIALLGFASPGHATRWDFRQVNGFLNIATAKWENCGIQVFGGISGGISTDPGFGIGVFGGTSDTTIDSNESVEVRFFNAFGLAQARYGVRYSVEVAGNENGQGGFGDGFLEAFDSMNDSLGIVAVSGVGVKDVNALFGGVSIRRFILTASGDSVRIAYVEYDAPRTQPVRLSSFDTGIIAGNPVEVCDVVLSGSSGVYLNQGLGVGGGLLPMVDGSESLLFEFPYPVTGVLMKTAAVSNSENHTASGEGFLEGFRGAQSLGVHAISGDADVDVTDLFGGEPITALELTADGDGRSIDSVRFTPEPGGLPAGLAGLAAMAARAWRARRRRQPLGARS
jgi:hypothetical protein